MKKLALIAFGAALAAGPFASAADTNTVFMEDAIRGNLAEVQMGELAQRNGVSQEVKDFGQTLQTDHTAGNTKAISLAQSVGAAVPNAPAKDEQNDYAKLAKLHGHDFDAQFVDTMIMDHKKDIAKYKAYETATKGSTPAVARFAQETLPTLQKHLEAAETLQKELR